MAEIVGCFAFWAWLRLDKSALWLVPGVLLLLAFPWVLTRVDVELAGRAYAAYGGVYIVASLAWLWAIDDVQPNRWDATGAAIYLLGAAVIVLGPRSVA